MSKIQAQGLVNQVLAEFEMGLMNKEYTGARQVKYQQDPVS
jgi:hypothetical protein